LRLDCACKRLFNSRLLRFQPGWAAGVLLLLATMVGLRRNEIDKLQWSAFRWNEGVVRIETTEHFTPKTADSGGDVPGIASTCSVVIAAAASCGRGGQSS
jgi:hypothetical protein